MDNVHAQWRLNLAGQLAERMCAFASVQAIVVGGSVARGYADEYSDLELPVFWDTLPGDDTRLALVAALGAEFLYGYDGPSQEDQLFVNGFQVDLWHNTVASEEVVIDSVLQDYSTDLGDSNFMDTVRACIPLYGDELIQNWKRRAGQYPDELAMRNIREHTAAFDASQLTLLARRDNPTAFYAQVSHLQQQVFQVLLALNRAYFPTFKWMYRSLESMRVKPQNVAQRFRHAFKAPYVEAAADMAQVLHETLDLVERHYPQVDTTAVRRRLGVVRTTHEKPVKL